MGKKRVIAMVLCGCMLLLSACESGGRQEADTAQSEEAGTTAAEQQITGRVYEPAEPGISLTTGMRSEDYYFTETKVMTVAVKMEDCIFRASIKDMSNPSDILYITTESIGDAWYFPAGIGDDMAREHYLALGKKASDCVRCGHCNNRCPFGVKQMERMSEIREYFGV